MKTCVNLYLAEFWWFQKKAKKIKTHCMPARFRKSCRYSKYRKPGGGMRAKE